MYLVTVLGNLLITLTIIFDSKLHTPMYFFLSTLSLADICFISTTVPKMIANILIHSRVISYAGCLTQMSLLLVFACMDDMLLVVMAFDRFVAICHPLQYHIILNFHLCIFFVLVSLLFSILDSQIHNLIALQFSYFKDVEISNFFSDPALVLSLSCSDSVTKNIVMYFVGAVYGFIPVTAIILSYYKIISCILGISSSCGKYKAFSTCASHLSVICLFYGTGIAEYFSSFMSSSRKSAVVSLMCTVVTPMLNPYIYSLRNRDIKSALQRLWSRTTKSHHLFPPSYSKHKMTF
ncbi:olfactory receptor 7E24-like [Fukomys damarensis]|uniref:olfactory receptor 7E24-like n=1 Tax=Fukomys damarensis TaxID=885580 RepID=UPI001455B6F7|nr:olfactory receptor 7E24-like [Fukomys damarensis]